MLQNVFQHNKNKEYRTTYFTAHKMELFKSLKIVPNDFLF